RLDELMTMCTEDCEMHLHGGGRFPVFSGRFVGRAAVRAKLQELSALFEHLEVLPKDFTIVGDMAVLHVVTRVRNRGTGPAKEVEGVIEVRFRGDLFCHSGHYVDTAALAYLADWPGTAGGNS